MRTTTAATMAAVLAALAGAARAQPASQPVKVEAPFYVIHADAEANVVREFVTRMNVVAEEYDRRLRGLGGQFRTRLQIHLFRQEADFVRAGGQAGTVAHASLGGGGGRLLILAPSANRLGWDFIQQIGFRHFASEVLSSRLPPWVEQGLAAYFGAARWTGDGLTAGLVPPGVIEGLRLQKKEGRLAPFDQVLGMGLVQWYQPDGQAQRNQQAWGMVQFLVHADGGRYGRPFSNYIVEAGKGTPPAEAFARHFGTDARTFQNRFEQWLAGPQAEPNAALATEATVATLTSFLARAHVLKVKCGTFEEFLQAAKDKKVLPEWSKVPALWLPEGLLDQCLQEAGKLSTWSLDAKRTPPALVLTESGGVTYTGTFSLPPGRRPAVKVERKGPKPPPATRPAR